jgi:hypothetical protein
MNSDTLSVIGFYLTLFGLLGSLFAVHLANWYREILALETKAELNKGKGTAEQQAAIRECRYKLREANNHVIYIVAFVVSAFLLFVFLRSLGLLTALPKPSNDKAQPDLIWEVGLAFKVFLAVYGILTIWFLIGGAIKGSKIKALVAG